MVALPWRFAVAPMMDRTDRHFRWFFRQLSRGALLYTPMIVAAAVAAAAGAALAHDAIECRRRRSSVATTHGCRRGRARGKLTLASPRSISTAAVLARCGAELWGARLMDQPQRVAECVAAMVAACRVDVTVKHRLGIAGRDDVASLHAFVDAVHDAGAARVIVHARAAVLGGLGPAANRSAPPLRPAEVHALVRAAAAAHPLQRRRPQPGPGVRAPWPGPTRSRA
ncbi:MAG: tRNA-dihydrouridine synthase [Nannocystaceae bacterium]